METNSVAELVSGVFDDDEEGFESFPIPRRMEGILLDRIMRAAEKRPNSNNNGGPSAKKGRENTPSPPTSSPSKTDSPGATLPNTNDINQLLMNGTNGNKNRAVKASRKSKKTQMFEKMCEDVNALAEKNKKILAINNLVEGTVYQISSFRYHETRAQNLAVVFELDDGLLYIPYKVTQFYIKEIFGILGMSLGKDLGVKSTDWHQYIIQDGENRILTPGLSMRIKTAPEGKYPDVFLMYTEP